MKRRWICGLILALVFMLACALCPAEEWSETGETGEMVETLTASETPEETGAETAATNGDLYPGKGQLVCLLPCGDTEMEVYTALLQEEEWLFLPTFADKTALRLVFPEELAALGLNIVSPEDASATIPVPEDGRVTLDWPAMASTEEDGVSYVLVKDGEGRQVLTLNVMQSENLRALFLFSDDPVNEGRVWLGDCDAHERSTSASLVFISQSGEIDHQENIEKLRGRGNTTWYRYMKKKPYQMKLEKKTDLLDLGTEDAKNKKFVLLAEARDATRVNNSTALTLGREGGVSAPCCEQVDLYYDGEYRGFYLLCEKVEVNPGRVDITNYEKIIEKVNKQVGQTDLEDLPIASGVNRYGCEYHYVEGLLDTGDPWDGGYFVELDRLGSFDDPCWFTLPGTNQPVVLKNPEYASESMVRAISEKLGHLFQTLQNRGVNPEDGTLLEEEMDLDSFAHLVFINELMMNVDAFRYSTTFVLEAGEDKFTAGPLWDFDLSTLRYRASGQSWKALQQVDSFAPELMTLRDLYRVPAFQKALARAAEELTPTVRNILLGEESGEALQPLDTLREKLRASIRMNERLYSPEDFEKEGGTELWDGEVNQMKAFLTERLDWLYAYFTGGFDVWELEVRAYWGHTEDAPRVDNNELFLGNVTDWTLDMLQEATEEAYALYEFTATLRPAEGMTIREVKVNGASVPFEEQEDGTLRVCCRLWDDSYRPVDYDGTDVGLIYNEEAFRANEPDISEEYEEDSEGLLQYFMEEGIYEGLKGNAFFDPHWIYLNVEDAAENLADCWDMYYWDYLDGNGEEWFYHTDMLHCLIPANEE